MAKLRGFMGLTKRNMLVFFTDKGTLFFSMLTPMIILLLYILFLKNNLLSSLKKKGFIKVIDRKYWVMAMSD